MTNATRTVRCWILAVLMGWLMLSGGAGIIVRADEGSRAVAGGDLWKAGLEAGQRLEAAKVVLRTNDPGLIARAQSTLRTPGNPRGTVEATGSAAAGDGAGSGDEPVEWAARRALLTAIAQSEQPAWWAVEGLVTLVAQADEKLVLEALPAVARYPHRGLVEQLLGRLEQQELSEAGRTGVMSALERMTGTGIGVRDAGWWVGWWNDRLALPSADWSAMVAANHARQNERLQRELGQRAERMGSLYRQLYGMLGEAERDALLAELIRSGEGVQREIGLELARRALLSARSLGGMTIEALGELTLSPSTSVRGQSAELLDRADPRGFSVRASQLLVTERSPVVAAALLRGVARSPREGMEELIADWATSGSEATVPAIEAALATAEAGLWEDEDSLERVVDVVLSRIPESISPAGVRLLGATGRLEKLRALIRSERAGVAEAAAGVLAEDASSFGVILEEAATRPELYEGAARALIRFEQTAEGLARLRGLPSPSEQVAARAVREMVDGLPASELLKASALASDDAERSTWLARAATEEFIASTEVELAARVLTLLARARLETGDVEGALRSVELMPTDADELIGAAERYEALVRLGRITEAEVAADAASLVPAQRIEGMRRVEDPEMVLQLIGGIRERFGEGLTLAEEATLSAMEQRAVASLDAAKGGEPVAEPDADTTDPPAGEASDGEV